MFTIYQKNIGGRVVEQYFQKWENAKKYMLSDIDLMRSYYGWTINAKDDYFNRYKGIYIYEYRGTTKAGERFTFALLDGYFVD